MSPRVVAVIQARMGSTRLPGKVLRPLGPRPVIEWVLRAALVAPGIDDVVVATTTLDEDTAVEACADRLGLTVHRGPVDDVLTRFVGAAEATGADAIVRLTADCPLLDPKLIAGIAGLWRSTGADYVSTITPRCLPRGLDVELISRPALAHVDTVAQDHHRVHVTSYVYAEPEVFDIVGLTVQPAADDLRVTLDTPADAELLDALVERLGDAPPSWQAVVAALRADPALAAMNADVTQKALVEG